jgi:hypothetical protein
VVNLFLENRLYPQPTFPVLYHSHAGDQQLLTASLTQFMIHTD